MAANQKTANNFRQFRIVEKANKKEADIHIYTSIGESFWEEGFTAKHMVEQLQKLDKNAKLNIYINSGGGDAFEGKTIYNQLKRHIGEKHVYVDALAASAASVIAMAGDKIFMPKSALMMIHNPWSMGFGESKDLRKAADRLDIIRETTMDIYHERTGYDRDLIGEMMDEETWMTSEQAIRYGFADEETEEEIKAFNMVGVLYPVLNAPKEIQESIDPKPTTRVTIEHVTAEEETEQETVANEELEMADKSATIELTEDKLKELLANAAASAAESARESAEKAQKAHEEKVRVKESLASVDTKLQDLVAAGKVTPAVSEAHKKTIHAVAEADLAKALEMADELIETFSAIEGSLIDENIEAEGEVKEQNKEFKFSGKFDSTVTKESQIADEYIKYQVAEGRFGDYKEAAYAMYGEFSEELDDVISKTLK